MGGKLFCLRESLHLGEEIASGLGMTLSQHEDKCFEDNEFKVTPLEPVNGENVFIIQSHFERTF